MALGLRLSLPVQDLKLSTKLGGWTIPHLCPLLNPFPCVPSPARHEHLSAQVRKVKTSQGKLPLPWASVGISFAMFLMGELQHSVTGGCTGRKASVVLTWPALSGEQQLKRGDFGCCFCSHPLGTGGMWCLLTGTDKSFSPLRAANHTELQLKCASTHY